MTAFNVCILEGLVGEVPWTSYENDINDHNVSTARIRQAVFPEPLESGIPNVSRKCQQLDLGLYELAPNGSVGLVTYIPRPQHVFITF